MSSTDPFSFDSLLGGDIEEGYPDSGRDDPRRLLPGRLAALTRQQLTALDFKGFTKLVNETVEYCGAGTVKSFNERVRELFPEVEAWVADAGECFCDGDLRQGLALRDRYSAFCPAVQSVTWNHVHASMPDGVRPVEWARHCQPFMVDTFLETVTGGRT
jgi:hypothetical protein